MNSISSNVRMIWSLGVIAACLILSVGACRATDVESNDCNDGKDRDAKIAACTHIIEDASQTLKNRAEAYLHRGNAYQREAPARWNRVTFQGPGSYMFPSHWIVPKDFDLAIADLDRAIELNPNSPAAYAGRGIAYNGKNDYQKAIADFNRAVELEPDSAAIYTGRGIAFYNQVNNRDAIADFNKAIELDPNYALVYYYRAFTCASEAKYESAIEDYNRFI
jgi:tetratricopeptide (TPR) repeat protein